MQLIKRIYNLLFPPPKKDQYTLMREKIENYRRLGADIGEYVRLWGRIDEVNPHLVTIGNCVCVGAETYLITHCPINPGPVVIENNCWIGFRSIILPNVTIGEGCMIGAGSVVTDNLIPYSIAAGNPAKVIGLRDMNELERTVYLIKNDFPVGKVEQ